MVNRTWSLYLSCVKSSTGSTLLALWCSLLVSEPVFDAARQRGINTRKRMWANCLQNVRVSKVVSVALTKACEQRWLDGVIFTIRPWSIKCSECAHSDADAYRKSSTKRWEDALCRSDCLHETASVWRQWKEMRGGTQRQVTHDTWMTIIFMDTKMRSPWATRDEMWLYCVQLFTCCICGCTVHMLSLWWARAMVGHVSTSCAFQCGTYQLCFFPSTLKNSKSTFQKSNFRCRGKKTVKTLSIINFTNPLHNGSGKLRNMRDIALHTTVPTSTLCEPIVMSLRRAHAMVGHMSTVSPSVLLLQPNSSRSATILSPSNHSTRKQNISEENSLLNFWSKLVEPWLLFRKKITEWKMCPWNGSPNRQSWSVLPPCQEISDISQTARAFHWFHHFSSKPDCNWTADVPSSILRQALPFVSDRWRVEVRWLHVNSSDGFPNSNELHMYITFGFSDNSRNCRKPWRFPRSLCCALVRLYR